MRVAIDTNPIYTSQAGVARYVRQLLLALGQLGSQAPEIHELAWPVENFSYRQPWRALKTAYRELWWAPWLAPRRLRDCHPDLLHSTAGCLIRPPVRLKHVVTLHDLAVLRFPGRFRRWHRGSTARRLRRLVRADRIICISRFTADEAIRFLGLPARQLEVVYNGGSFVSATVPPAECAPSERVPAEFLLFVGSLEPGKNLAILRQTYELAARKNVALPDLLILGARWEGTRSEGSPPPQWHYLGRQSDAVLVYLWRRAVAFLFPSKYEGFGLPVVEAMSLGCPVICSRVASLEEVGGSAALYSAQTPEGYLEAIRQVLGSSTLRQELVQHGYAQSRRFTWRRCAEETLAVYRSVLTSG